MTDILTPKPHARPVPVWEPGLRIWHWSNALVVLLLFETYLLFDWHKELGFSKDTTTLFQKAHIVLGWVFVALFLSRIRLLFRGDTFSRLPDLLPKTQGRPLWTAIRQDAKNHLLSMAGQSQSPEPVREPGHDPVARLLYLALFAVVFPLQIVTGILWSSLKWGYWPLPFLHALPNPTGHNLKEILSDIHATGMYVIAGFFVLHIGGVVTDEIRHRSGILSAMIHGTKTLGPAEIDTYRERKGKDGPASKGSSSPGPGLDTM